MSEDSVVDYENLTQYSKEILTELYENGGMSNIDGSEFFDVYRNNFYRKMVSLQSHGLVVRASAGENANCDYVWFLSERGRRLVENRFRDLSSPEDGDGGD